MRSRPFPGQNVIPVSVAIGEVLADLGDGVVTVDVQDATLTLGHLSSYTPTVGDPVLVLFAGTCAYVLGSALPGTAGGGGEDLWVNTTGDVMTGNLTIHHPQGLPLILDAPATSVPIAVLLTRADASRWMLFADALNGDCLTVQGYPDAGNARVLLTANRTTGLITALAPAVGGTALPLHDTDWRTVTSNLANGWTASGLQIRRQGNLVLLRILNLNAASRTGSVFYFVPSGFTPASGVAGLVGSNAAAGALVRRVNSASSTPTQIEILNSATSDTSLSGTAEWFTDDPWPTSYPGTPA